MKLFRHVAILYRGMWTESKALMGQADFVAEDPDTYSELLFHYVLPKDNHQPGLMIELGEEGRRKIVKIDGRTSRVIRKVRSEN